MWFINNFLRYITGMDMISNKAGRPRLKPILFYLCLALACSFAGYYFFDIRMEQMKANSIPIFHLENESRRILVISPHPDDESIAAGGLITDAVEKGYPVRVVFITSGDGFRRGLEVYRPSSNLEPGDFLDYGKLRMDEARTASGFLGLDPEGITFLGYPDGGLDEVWRNCWEPELPYRAYWTKRSSVPYQDAFSPDAAYIASNVIQDLKRVMQEFQPTDIILPDLEDTHPDHCTGGVFTLAAVAAWDQDQDGLYRQPQLYTYLVHASSWQRHPGVDRNSALLPPRDYTKRGTKWYRYPLTAASLNKKRQALHSYQSQMIILGSFLDNFLRPNEIFCQMQVKNFNPHQIGDEVMIAVDPKRDVSKGRTGQGGDLRSLYLSVLTSKQELRLLFWDKISADNYCRVNICTFFKGSDRSINRYGFDLKPTSADMKGVVFGDQGVSIDLNNILGGLGGQCCGYLLIEAEVRDDKTVIDRIPWQLMKVVCPEV